MNCLSSNRGNPGLGCGRLKRMTGAAATERVRVVVGDDHPLFRDGVVRASRRADRSRWWQRPKTV